MGASLSPGLCLLFRRDEPLNTSGSGRAGLRQIREGAFAPTLDPHRDRRGSLRDVVQTRRITLPGQRHHPVPRVCGHGLCRGWRVRFLRRGGPAGSTPRAVGGGASGQRACRGVGKIWRQGNCSPEAGVAVGQACTDRPGRKAKVRSCPEKAILALCRRGVAEFCVPASRPAAGSRGSGSRSSRSASR